MTTSGGIVDISTAATMVGRSADTIRQWVLDGDLTAVPVRILGRQRRYVRVNDLLRVEAQKHKGSQENWQNNLA